MDAHDDPKAELQRASMDELMQRASSLVIPGWTKMSREELVQALAIYSRGVAEKEAEQPTMPDL